MVNQNILDGNKVDKFLGAFPQEFMKLNRDEQKISKQIYKLLAEGVPVTKERLAISLGASEEEITSTIEKWRGIFYNKEGAIVGYWGLALGKMGHEFEVDGKTLYTWCSWDSLFIPQILGKAANVASKDPVTNDTIHLTVTPENGIKQVNPESAVVSFMIPDTDKVRSDVIKKLLSLCSFLQIKRYRGRMDFSK